MKGGEQGLCIPTTNWWRKARAGTTVQQGEKKSQRSRCGCVSLIQSVGTVTFEEPGSPCPAIARLCRGERVARATERGSTGEMMRCRRGWASVVQPCRPGRCCNGRHRVITWWRGTSGGARLICQLTCWSLPISFPVLLRRRLQIPTSSVPTVTASSYFWLLISHSQPNHRRRSSS
jgi:hypothetical protein